MSIWTTEGLRHITPSNLENPEGFDVKKLLSDMVGNDLIADYGCGRGRLASAFDPSRYYGYDINLAAIERAQDNNPAHIFSHIAPPDMIDVTLLYTVALHQPDSEIAAFLAGIKSDRVIIAEIMRPDLAAPQGIPPTFNRSEVFYSGAMCKNGYRLERSISRPYAHYSGVNITFQEYRKNGD